MRQSQSGNRTLTSSPTSQSYFKSICVIASFSCLLHSITLISPQILPSIPSLIHFAVISPISPPPPFPSTFYIHHQTPTPIHIRHPRAHLFLRVCRLRRRVLLIGIDRRIDFGKLPLLCAFCFDKAQMLKHTAHPKRFSVHNDRKDEPKRPDMNAFCSETRVSTIGSLWFIFLAVMKRKSFEIGGMSLSICSFSNT